MGMRRRVKKKKGANLSVTPLYFLAEQRGANPDSKIASIPSKKV